MTLQNLLRRNTKAKVMKRLAVLYPDQKKNLKGYRKVWDELLTKRKRKADVQLVLREFKEDGEKWIDVSGHKEGDKYPCWGLDFTSRSEWLGMEIHPDTIDEYPEQDILAHALWEMTWHGFTDKKVRNTKRMLMGRVKSVISKYDR